jgi:hypothetical protein
MEGAILKKKSLLVTNLNLRTYDWFFEMFEKEFFGFPNYVF